MKITKFMLFIYFFVALSALAEDNTAVYHEDWQSPTNIVNAVYETISADKGAIRNWERFRELFLDNSRFSMAIKSPQFAGIVSQDVEEMILQTDQYYKSLGFHEIELEKKVFRYNNLASVYSTFEVKHNLSDKSTLMRGLNHFQLLFDGDRWWIISNITSLEDKETGLPEF